MIEPTFPVLWQGSREYQEELARLACPRTIPWWLVKQHETQAMRNHGGQSLARLAERGGLGPDELCAVLEDRPWTRMSTADQVLQLHDLITACPTDELTPMQIALAGGGGAGAVLRRHGAAREIQPKPATRQGSAGDSARAGCAH